MNVRFIKNKFYVMSETKNDVYVVDRNLSCNCKGFFFHNHCKHQKMVEKYIQSGDIYKDLK